MEKLKSSGAVYALQVEKPEEAALMTEFYLILLIAYAVCFALFSLLFFFLHALAGKEQPYINASEDVVDLFLLKPAGWLFSLLYFLYLAAAYPVWWLTRGK